ncbi:MAG: ABC transporter ATP-binding protein/permease [Cyclobacteriaceae bacterium]|nr:ABC transporter ATP-binding protein/permease [Cyclobacteriaceae bacterium]
MAKEKTEKLTPFKQLLNVLHAYRDEVNSIFIYAFFSGLISLSVPLGIQAIVNLIQGAQISTSWIVLVILVTVGIIATGVLMIMQHVVSENIQQKIFVKSAFDFAYRVPKFNAEAVDKEFVPELVNRFFDTIVVQKGISKILLEYSIAAIQIILGLILLMFYHPFFISFGVSLILIIYFIIKYTFPIGLSASIKESKYKYKLVHWLEDIGRSMKTFKLAGSSSFPLEKTDKLTTEWIKYRKAHFKILIIQYICMVGFKAFIAGGLLIIGGLLVINQQMNIGQFVAAEIIILTILVSVEKMISGSETFFDVLTSLGKLGEIKDIPLENEGEIVLDENNDGLSVQINNMSFRFPEEKKDMLHNINFSALSGEKIGISGYQGSGKSLLLDIIAGLYPKTTDAVTYNGFPLSNINIGALRGMIGDNLRENIIFEGTIYENISMGKKEIPLEEVLKACEPIDFLEYIQSLPNGFDTMVLSEGRTLPQSIRLKIILARCIAEKPKLILLEDNLGHLKSATRKKFIEYLFDENTGWTVITASNNPEVLTMLDRVIVIDKGEIVDEDSYDELSKKEWMKNLFNIK